MLEAFLEGQVYFGVYRALGYPVDQVFNRVLNRYDAGIHIFEIVNRTVEGGRFPGPRWARYKDNAARDIQRIEFEPLEHLRIHPDFIQAQEQPFSSQQPQDDLLAPHGHIERDPDVQGSPGPRVLEFYPAALVPLSFQLCRPLT